MSTPFESVAPRRLGARWLAFALVSVSLLRAQLTIIPIFDSSITSSPNSVAIQSAVNQVIGTYANTFSTPITISITFSDMASGLGQSSKLVYGVTYSSFYSALSASATSANDTTALASLPSGSLNPVTSTSTVVLTGANVLALGGTGAGYATGSTIGLNTSLMNLTRTTIDPSKYDIFAVTSHEIDEVLGLGSLIGTSGFPGPFVEDLFRYTAAGARTYTTSGDDAYFSINGGLTQLARFNQNAGGDYGDWWSPSGVPQVQDAFGTPGSTPNLGVEVVALDVIGFTTFSSVPEPATTAAWIAAGMLGVAAWRRKRATGERDSA